MFLFGLCPGGVSLGPLFFGTRTAGAPVETVEKGAKAVLFNDWIRRHAVEKAPPGLWEDPHEAGLDQKQLKLRKQIRHQDRAAVIRPLDEKEVSTFDGRQAPVSWIDSTPTFSLGPQQTRQGVARRCEIVPHSKSVRGLLGFENDLADSIPAEGVSGDGFRNHCGILRTLLMLETYLELAGKAPARSIADPGRRSAVKSFCVELGAKITRIPFTEIRILSAGGTNASNFHSMWRRPRKWDLQRAKRELTLQLKTTVLGVADGAANLNVGVLTKA